MPERIIPEMTDDQVHTLMGRIRRADALNNAITVVTMNPSPIPRVQEEMLDELRTLSEEAEEMKRYKTELGMPAFGRPE